MPRFMRKRGSNHLEPYKLVYAEHERLALLLSRYGNWERCPGNLLELLAEDILLAYGGRFAPSNASQPVENVPVIRRTYYERLIPICARLMYGHMFREVYLMDPLYVGRLAEYFFGAAA